MGATVMDQVDRLRVALAGRYEVDREIGRGGMAYVYRAHDRQHDRDVALKVLRPELAAALGVERFLREIRIEARLQHPHILPLYDSGTADGLLYYVMPYVEGETLRDRIRREKQLPVGEAVRIAREAGLPLEISHHKAAGRNSWGKTEQSIALIEKERAAGLDVTFDAYPYTAGSTILAVMARGREAGPEDVIVATVRNKPEYEGKTLAQIADMLDIPADQAAQRVLADDPSAVAVFFMMDEPDVRRVLAHPLCMIGSDGIPSPTGKPHPRLYGTFPRVLGMYARDEHLFPLEEAVRKMTSLPAQRMNLPERGELREGWAADIVIFNPSTIADTATYPDPRRYPAGIEYVIVNGEIAAEGGKQTPARAGHLLRRGQAA